MFHSKQSIKTGMLNDGIANFSSDLFRSSFASCHVGATNQEPKMTHFTFKSPPAYHATNRCNTSDLWNAADGTHFGTDE